MMKNKHQNPVITIRLKTNREKKLILVMIKITITIRFEDGNNKSENRGERGAGGHRARTTRNVQFAS